MVKGQPETLRALYENPFAAVKCDVGFFAHIGNELCLLARIRKRGFLIMRRLPGESLLKAGSLARSMS